MHRVRSAGNLCKEGGARRCRDEARESDGATAPHKNRMLQRAALRGGGGGGPRREELPRGCVAVVAPSVLAVAATHAGDHG